MRKLHRSAALLLGALIIACDSSSPTSPVQGLDTDLNIVEVTTGGVSGYATAGTGFASGGGFAPALPPMYPSRCAYNAATQFFACPTVSARGMVIVRKYQLLDAAGSPLAAADPLSLAAIRSVIDVQGTTTGMMVNRHEDNTLSGLQSANRTLNGTSTQDLTLTTPDGSVALVTHDESSISDLSILRSLDQQYPLGGTIISDGTTSFSNDEFVSHYHREVVFDGTSVVTVKNDYGSGWTTTCKIDLANSSRSSTTCVSGTTGL
jgi:hypothetical protein